MVKNYKHVLLQTGHNHVVEVVEKVDLFLWQIKDSLIIAKSRNQSKESFETIHVKYIIHLAKTIARTAFKINKW